MAFDNISHEFDEGRITTEVIEQLLDEAFGDDEDKKTDRRSRLYRDGKLVKFQVVGLNKQATEALANPRVQEQRAPEVPSGLTDDVPEFDDEGPQGPDYVPDIKSKLGIISAVRMFGKQQQTIRSNRSEGVKVRCPFSHHEDKRPSAWVNTDKNTWYCGKCQVGGDVIDFYAAAKHDMAPGDFHRSPQFRAITEEMADHLGIEVYTPYDTSQWGSPLPDEVESDDEEPEPEPEPITDEELGERMEPENRSDDPPVPRSSEADEPVTISEAEMLRGVSFEHDDLTGRTKADLGVLKMDVDGLQLPDNTFLCDWMMTIRKAFPWVPEEYVLMLGIQAIGLAAGHHVISSSANLPLTGSLLVSIIGPSGYGKSTAARILRDLISTSGPAVKFDPSSGTGIKEISSPASAEALVMNVKTEVEDPSNATGPKIEKPTTGWLFEDELATFVSRTRRAGGSHMKQRLMQFHDFAKVRNEPEAVFDEAALVAGKRIVHDAFLSATFLTQTESLRSLAESVDLVSGFLNRIVPVFGCQRSEQDMFHDYTLDPNAFYKTRYENLYRVCREDSTIFDPHFIKFSNGAQDYYRNHPFMMRARGLINEHPIYARLQHIALRLSLIMAINEHARDAHSSNSKLSDFEIEAQHVELAIQIMEQLIEPGFERMMKAVLANEVEEYMNDFVHYVQEHLVKHDKFPTKKATASARFNNSYPINVRRQGQEYLIKSGLVVEIHIANKTKGIPHYAVPEGRYSGLVNNMTYKAEEIYK